jgi:hypothetical protein
MSSLYKSESSESLPSLATSEPSEHHSQIVCDSTTSLTPSSCTHSIIASTPGSGASDLDKIGSTASVTKVSTMPYGSTMHRVGTSLGSITNHHHDGRKSLRVSEADSESSDSESRRRRRHVKSQKHPSSPVGYPLHELYQLMCNNNIRSAMLGCVSVPVVAYRCPRMSDVPVPQGWYTTQVRFVPDASFPGTRRQQIFYFRICMLHHCKVNVNPDSTELVPSAESPQFTIPFKLVKKSYPTKGVSKHLKELSRLTQQLRLGLRDVCLQYDANDKTKAFRARAVLGPKLSLDVRVSSGMRRTDARLVCFVPLTRVNPEQHIIKIVTSARCPFTVQVIDRAGEPIPESGTFEYNGQWITEPDHMCTSSLPYTPMQYLDGGRAVHQELLAQHQRELLGAATNSHAPMPVACSNSDARTGSNGAAPAAPVGAVGAAGAVVTAATATATDTAAADIHTEANISVAAAHCNPNDTCNTSRGASHVDTNNIMRKRRRTDESTGQHAGDGEHLKPSAPYTVTPPSLKRIRLDGHGLSSRPHAIHVSPPSFHHNMSSAVLLTPSVSNHMAQGQHSSLLTPSASQSGVLHGMNLFSPAHHSSHRQDLDQSSISCSILTEPNSISTHTPNAHSVDSGDSNALTDHAAHSVAAISSTATLKSPSSASTSGLPSHCSDDKQCNNSYSDEHGVNNEHLPLFASVPSESSVRHPLLAGQPRSPPTVQISPPEARFGATASSSHPFNIRHNAASYRWKQLRSLVIPPPAPFNAPLTDSIMSPNFNIVGSTATASASPLSGGHLMSPFHNSGRHYSHIGNGLLSTPMARRSHPNPGLFPIMSPHEASMTIGRNQHHSGRNDSIGGNEEQT